MARIFCATLWLQNVLLYFLKLFLCLSYLNENMHLSIWTSLTPAFTVKLMAMESFITQERSLLTHCSHQPQGGSVSFPRWLAIPFSLLWIPKIISIPFLLATYSSSLTFFFLFLPHLLCCHILHVSHTLATLFQSLLPLFLSPPLKCWYSLGFPLWFSDSS